MIFSFKPFTYSILFSAALLFINGISFAQKAKDVDNKFYIALSPLALIDYKDGSSVRISADIRLYKNYSISTENVLYTSIGNFFSYKIDPRGFAIKPCIKFYLNDDNSASGVYIGIEYQYKPQTYHLHDSISINSAPKYFKQYLMTRYTNCVTLKVGELTNLNKKILFEWFGGVGIRFFNSSSSLTNQEYDGIIRGEKYSNSTGGGFQARQIGKKIFPNFSIGIKIGYKVK